MAASDLTAPMGDANPTAPSSDDVPQSQVIRNIATNHNRLYLSHLLSTLSSRIFEFGSTLYLAHAFPGTLLPLSVYALCRGLAAVILSPSVGRYIDTSPSRLIVVRQSIVYARVAVVLSCVGFWCFSSGWDLWPWQSYALLAALSMAACVEKLCSVMNLVSVEKDWVVVIAGGDEGLLREMNAAMRRIDLGCKLLGPFLISVVDGYSTTVAVIANLATAVVSLPIEWYAIKWVYDSTPALQHPKVISATFTPSGTECHATATSTTSSWKHSLHQQTTLLHTYFSHRAFRPSLAGALLYFTVLSFSGQMVTFLLAVGFSSLTIACLRTLSVVFEVSATWLAPAAMRRVGAVRAGIWFLSWQGACLAVGVVGFLLLGRDGLGGGRTSGSSIAAALSLVAGTILSRVGLWGFDLSTQLIVQEEVEAQHRGSFSAVEASMQNGFELCSFAATVVWNKPEQFRWPVLASCANVYVAGVLYAWFVRDRRGHLVHFCEGMGMKRGHGLYEDEEEEVVLELLGRETQR
ncbi:Solute carrier family 40 member 1 [Cyphellophora attinorum]|uniref:Solute carrier family 40 member n=1 Tax=Cyphellophora attinorum TaxID=1664694 RepID=A0A0N1HEL3_9EURO|nr:Solute carrier family 40 member 1 [Phialophora attinorum]KPI43466.1 Solute carrier family 40 member 1 [Phialophora attinorum]